MESQLSIELREYLKRCGLSESKVAQCSGSTRLYHDLGLYGEIAEGCMELLVDHYRVDLSGFEFDKFFPPEFAGKSALISALLSIVPFANYIARQRGEWLPLTLDEIDHAIRNKRWTGSMIPPSAGCECQ